MKKIAKTIIGIVMVALTLSSCSKSTAEKQMDVVEELCTILDNTTAENADAMVEKLTKLEAKAKEINEAKKPDEKPTAEEKERAKELAKKAFGSLIKLGVQAQGKDADKFDRVGNKAGAVMRALGE